jgi:type VI protein secretion system component VasK
MNAHLVVFEVLTGFFTYAGWRRLFWLKITEIANKLGWVIGAACF